MLRIKETSIFLFGMVCFICCGSKNKSQVVSPEQIAIGTEQDTCQEAVDDKEVMPSDDSCDGEGYPPDDWDDELLR